MRKSKLGLLWICASLLCYVGCNDDSQQLELKVHKSGSDDEQGDKGKKKDNDKSVCGNGIVDKGEKCDDGNDDNEDGCTSKCKWSFDDFERKSASDGKEMWVSEEGQIWCSIDEDRKMTCQSMKCGDGKLDNGEQCDSDNPAKYGVDANGKPRCDDTCHFAHYCGDGHVDEAFGEECDNGDENDDYLYNGCTTSCTLGPHCGDDELDPDHEICDIGSANDNEGCLNCTEVEEGFDCTNGLWCMPLSCGDGYLDRGENCDDGNRISGDGCTAECQIEEGYKCQHMVGKEVPDENGIFSTVMVNACTECESQNVACMLIAYGNGIVDPDGYEECDDGNSIDNDGCTHGKIDPGYECATAGNRCTAKSCSDGIMAYGEMCDDGNSVSGDGCSAQCELETGFRCTTAKNGLTVCDPAKGVCGDSIVQNGETCDDGNRSPGDGCSAQCQVEANFKCPTNPGGACVPSVGLCGNGIIDRETDFNIWEECDLGVDASGNSRNIVGSGCNQCRIETGYHCGIIAGVYQCQKGRCRDGYRDVGEECDDGNKSPNDGCSPSCKRELMFTEFIDEDGIVTYSPKCGDGITLWMIPRRDSAGKTICKTEADKDKNAPYTTEKDLKDHYNCEFGFVPAEACDDGNLIGGDGCSKRCEIEQGYVCTDFRDMASAPTIDLDISYYDFRNPSQTTTAGEPASWNASNEGTGGFMTRSIYNNILAVDASCASRSTFSSSISGSTRKGFPDFGCTFGGSGCGGMVENHLDADGKMVLVPNWASKNCTIRNTGVAITSHVSCAGTFHYWYRYAPGVNIQINTKLRMTQDPNDHDRYTFFADNWGPIAGQGYHSGTASPRAESEGNFTSALHTYFQYKGGETLKFSGNDDVWAFINKTLFVDLGGMQSGNSDQNTLSNSLCVLDGETLDTKCDPRYDIYENGIYELHFFQAERCWPGSTYQLTLDGFLNTGKSDCHTSCGDGVISAGEECDNGSKNNDDLYDGCTTACKRGPHCGDGVVTHDEQCDDGNNLDGDGCSPTCRTDVN